MKCNQKGHQGGNEPGTSEEHVPEYCFSEGCVPDACALTIFAGEHHCTFTQIDRMILFSRQKQTQTLPEKTELVSYENIKHKVIKHTIWSASYTDSLPTPSRSQCNASPLFHKSYVEEQFRYMNCPAMDLCYSRETERRLPLSLKFDTRHPLKTRRSSPIIHWSAKEVVNLQTSMHVCTMPQPPVANAE